MRGVVPAERHPCARLDLDCGCLSHARAVAEALPGLRQACCYLLAVHQAIEKRCLVPRPEWIEGERGEHSAVNVCEWHREASHDRFQREHLGQRAMHLRVKPCGLILWPCVRTGAKSEMAETTAESSEGPLTDCCTAPQSEANLR